MLLIHILTYSYICRPTVHVLRARRNMSPGIDDPRLGSKSSHDRTADLMVPFQRYSFDAFIFAVDPTTNHSVRIAMFGVDDTLGDFFIRSHDVADMSEFPCDSGNGSVTMEEVESRLLHGEIKRSAIAKAFAICLFIANWTLTVGSVYITALVAARMLEANSIVAALPFGVPLTIPAIRSLYVDSPPLGTSIGQSCDPRFCHSVSWFNRFSQMGWRSSCRLRP